MPRSANPTPARRLLDAVPPASGAVVMGTGIISVALEVDGDETLSRVLLVLTAIVWVALGLLLAGRVLTERARARLEATSPGALTGVAGTAVLGARVVLLGWDLVGAALLALVVCLWLVLMPRVLAAWNPPTVGVSFMLTVATESIAVLAAVLALRERVEWLALVALASLVLGAVAYVFVLARFDLRQLLTGQGDHWVSGGALAIVTLACGRTADAAQDIPALHGLASGLDVATLAIWAAAVAWLPALLVCELLAPRLGYDVRRWATVFPFGMYAACSHLAGEDNGIGGLVDFSRVWVWIAFAVWIVVTAGLLRRGLELYRRAAA